MEHYDNSINQRVIWLSIGQSFFFNVYAMLITAKAPTPELIEKQRLLAVLFPAAALLTAVFTMFDVVSILFYVRKLRKMYEDASKGEVNNSIYPPIFGIQRDRLFQRLSPIMIPAIFIATWTYLLFF